MSPFHFLLISSAFLIFFTPVKTLAALLSIPSPNGPTTNSSIPPIAYVALGDSFASGRGLGNPVLPNPFNDPLCQQTTGSYPFLFASSFPSGGINFMSLACAYYSLYDMIFIQSSLIPPSTDLVSVTAGVNDIAFGSVVQNCDSNADSSPGGRCDSALSYAEVRARYSPLPSGLTGRMWRLLRLIEGRAPRAKIVVIGYSRFLGSPVAKCNTHPGYSPDGQATARQKDRMNALMLRMNYWVRDVTKGDRRVMYRDPDDDFTGHRYCDGEGREWFQRGKPGQDEFTWERGWYHPNEKGVEEYVRLLTEAWVGGG